MDLEEIGTGYKTGWHKKGSNSYKMENKEIKIRCYADDASVTAGNEEDLQELVHKFDIAAKLSMDISAEKKTCTVFYW